MRNIGGFTSTLCARSSSILPSSGPFPSSFSFSFLSSASSSSSIGAFRNAVRMSIDFPDHPLLAASSTASRTAMASEPDAKSSFLSAPSAVTKLPQATIRTFLFPFGLVGSGFKVHTSLDGMMSNSPFFFLSSISSGETFLRAPFVSNRDLISFSTASFHLGKSLLTSCIPTTFVWSTSSGASSSENFLNFQSSFMVMWTLASSSSMTLPISSRITSWILLIFTRLSSSSSSSLGAFNCRTVILLLSLLLTWTGLVSFSNAIHFSSVMGSWTFFITVLDSRSHPWSSRM